MKKLFIQINIICIAIIGFFFILPQKEAYASCPGFTVTVNGKAVDQNNIPSGVPVTFSANVSTLHTSKTVGGYYQITARSYLYFDNAEVPDSNNVISATLDAGNGAIASGANRTFQVLYNTNSLPATGYPITLCEDSYYVSDKTSGACSISIQPAYPSIKDTITATVSITSTDPLNLVYDAPNVWHAILANGATSKKYTIPNNGIGAYKIWLETSILGSHQCSTDFTVTTDGVLPQNPDATLCSFATSENQEKCTKCFNDSTSPGVWTAIGCVPTTMSGFVSTIIPFGIGIAGGIAFLLILFGALQMMISAGNPEKLNAGKELIGAAITGLLLIIFSVFILQLIGFQILHIPGFK